MISFESAQGGEQKLAEFLASSLYSHKPQKEKLSENYRMFDMIEIQLMDDLNTCLKFILRNLNNCAFPGHVAECCQRCCHGSGRLDPCYKGSFRQVSQWSSHDYPQGIS